MYGCISVGLLWLANKLGFFFAPLEINFHVLKAVFKSMFIPGLLFAGIVTGMYAIIRHKVVDKEQELRHDHLTILFRSFLLLTAVFCVCYYLVVLLIINSGNKGLIEIMPYINIMSRFFEYGMPVMWLMIAWYWIVKYESKLLNEDEEWMLK